MTTESGTILLVEDEAFVREVTREVLESAGYRMLTAANAAAAIRVHGNDRNVDLLLTDVVLPGEPGPALAAKLRRENPQLVVLFVTGYIEQIKIAKGKGNYLAKPFSSETLVRTVRRLLSTKNSDASAFSGVAAPTSGLHDVRGNL